MTGALVALLLAVLRALGPGWDTAGDAREIVAAVAQAVLEDSASAPVYSSHLEDAVVMVTWAARESSLRLSAVNDGGRSWGAWQQGAAFGRQSALGQARAWLRLLHEGAARCREHPGAIAWGACHARDVLTGRDVAELAGDRERRARRLLVEALWRQVVSSGP